MLHKILNRWSSAILFEAEAESLREVVAKALESGANLTPVRDDIWAVLSGAPAEVPGLRLAIAEGRIDGSTYSGECACLVGTLANVAKRGWNGIPLLKPNSERPAERWFLGIKKGDTPETNQFSKLAIEWVDQWLDGVRRAFGPQAEPAPAS